MKKAKRTRTLLNDIQREAFQLNLFDLSELQLNDYYTLNTLDKKIIFERRTKHIQLGYAVQLCLLRYPGFIPTDILAIPLDIVEFIAKQISVDAVELLSFVSRPTTLREHRQEIKQRFGFTKYSNKIESKLIEILADYAEKNRSVSDMLHLLLDYLRKQSVIIPAISYLESIVWAAKEDANQQAQDKLLSLLNDKQLDQLQILLFSHELHGLTNLGWLKSATKKATAKTFQTVDDKLLFLLQFSFIPAELPISPLKQREYVSLAQTYEASSLRELNKNKRQAILICYIHNKRKQLTDEAIHIHLALMASNIKHSKKKLEELGSVEQWNGIIRSEWTKKIRNADLTSFLIFCYFSFLKSIWNNGTKLYG